jgi:hypothetical protein
MADRKLEIITKKQAAELLEKASVLPGEIIDRVNKEIQKTVEKEGKTELIIDRNYVVTLNQWKSLQNHLKDAGWDVEETCSQMGGTYITIK